MINGLRIGANEGGQQPSDGLYLVNPKTPCVHMQASLKTSRFCGELNRQIQEVETTLSYRKQRTANCSNSQKIKKWDSQFSASIGLFFVLQRPLSARRNHSNMPLRQGQIGSILAHSRRQTSKSYVVQSYFGAQ
jgi:hypothetical protein